MVMKTYSYHVYQPKAKSKQGRFVDLGSKSTSDQNGRARKDSTGRESRNPLVATTEAGPVMSDNPQLTPQLFAATQQAILKSQQQQQHVSAQGGSAPHNYSTSQYTFQSFKMKGRASQPSKRPSATSTASASASAATSHGSMHNFYGQPPLAIRPLILPDLAMSTAQHVTSFPESLPPLAPYSSLVNADALSATTATLPSTPQYSSASTPIPQCISPSASVNFAEAATPPMPSAMAPLVDNMIMASLDSANFTNLSEHQQLELMNAAVTQFAGLSSENLVGLNALSGHGSPGADSALTLQSLDSLSQGWDASSLFSDGNSSPDGLGLLDENFLIEDFLL